jgi:type IV pilus assembly protein PilE
MKNKLGFSLLEMVIVLLMIGILTAIAYPSYHHIMHRIWRSQALAQLRQAESKAADFYFLNNLSYENLNVPALGLSDHSHYAFSVIQASRLAFSIVATPLFAEDECGAWSINQLGVIKSTSECEALNARS